MAKKAANATPIPVEDGVRPGTGAARSKTRLIVPYGAPGTRKTTAAGRIKGAKWIITDQNTVPTLEAEDLMPPDRDLYEVADMNEARALVNEFTDAGAAGKLRLPAVVFDSVTALSDFLGADIAKAHGQQYLGENPKDNGWQDFNSQMGRLIDGLGELARYVNVLAVCHAKEKADPKRGDFHGLNLSPQMAYKLARVANWVLYHTIASEPWGESMEEGSMLERVETPNGPMAIRCQVNTMTVGLWTVKINAKKLDAVEPADYGAILKKEGLIG